MKKSCVLLMVMMCSLMGCCESEPSTGSSGADAAAQKIRVQLNWFPEPEFGGLYEAKRRGLFADAGLDVELLKGGPDVPAPQMIASGRVEFGLVSAGQLLTLRSQGGGLTGIFATFQKYPRGIVVKDDSSYTSLESLWKSSATVMGQDGLPFMKWLNRQYGGEDLSFVPYGGSLAPFISGKVDAMQCFVTAEPVQLSVDGVKNRVFLLADSGFNPYVAVIAVNDTVLKERPKMVAAFLGALREGWRSYLDTPEETNALLRSLNPDMKPDVLAGASKVLPGFVESDVTTAHGIGWMQAKRFEELAQQLIELGELSEADLEKAGSVFINTPGEGAVSTSG